MSHVYATQNPGQILIHFDSDSVQKAHAMPAGKQVGLSAITGEGAIHWSCTNANITDRQLLRYMPSSCRR